MARYDCHVMSRFHGPIGENPLGNTWNGIFNRNNKFCNRNNKFI